MADNGRVESGRQLPLPSLTELGRDLLHVSRTDLAVSVVRPAVCFILFWVFATAHHYLWAALAAVGLMFFTYTSTSHDLVHRTLPIPAFWTEIWLCTIEALCLRSGHAFRLTHLQHHKRFPHEDDLEGADAAKGFWQALACGPLLQVRLYSWAWRHGSRTERRWMAGEAFFVVSVFAAALVLWKSFPALALYVVLVTVASWIFPLATVWWPHNSAGATPVEQTRGFRGLIVPFLFFQHTYHLEHHLYPGVSSHRWAELGRRLEPFLIRAGVKFVHLP